MDGYRKQVGAALGIGMVVGSLWISYRRYLGSSPRSPGWFKQLFGFEETCYERAKLNFLYHPPTAANNYQGTITSLANQKTFSVGKFSTPSLGELRTQILARSPTDQKINLTRFHTLVKDIYALHQEEQMAGAIFQVASQFNCLEFPSPHHLPEHGVTNYASDLTQGPACSIACPSGTVFRNYFVDTPQGNQGQTADDQLNNLGGVEDLVENGKYHYWTTRNGYTDSTPQRLARFNSLWQEGEWNADVLRDSIRIGLHEDVPVVGVYEEGQPIRHNVTQTFCSALSIGYSQAQPSDWEPLARLVLEAMYESTMLVAARRALQEGSATVVLTFLGGGVFGNNWQWIIQSMARSMALVAHCNIQVHIAYHRRVDEKTQQLIDEEFDRYCQELTPTPIS